MVAIKPVLTHLDFKSASTAKNLAQPVEQKDAVRLMDLTAARQQLEEALTLSINQGDTTINQRIDDLALGLSEAQVLALISAAVQGGLEYRGVAAGDAVDAAEATGETDPFQQGWMYRISSGGSSAFGFPTSVGDFVIYNAQGGWDKLDNSSPSVSGQGVVEVEIVGENEYRVKLSQSFLDQIAADEAAIAALQNVTTQHEAALQQIEADQVVMQESIDLLSTDVAIAKQDVIALTTAISNEASTRGSQDLLLQSQINGIVSDNQVQDQSILQLQSAQTATAQAINDLSEDLEIETAARVAAGEAISLSVTEVAATTLAHGARLETVEGKIAQYWFKVQGGQVLETSANANAGMLTYVNGVYTITHGKGVIITPEVLEISGTSAEHAIVRKGVSTIAMTNQSFVELPEADTFIVTV
jgi:hypothetical protein